MAEATLLLGGGLDSTLLLAAAYGSHSAEVKGMIRKDLPGVPHITQALWVDYGQAAAYEERAAAQYFCAKYETPLRVDRYVATADVNNRCPAMYAGRITDFSAGICRQDFDVPGRNLMLIGLAAMHSNVIVVGAHAEPKDTFADARPAFWRDLSKALQRHLKVTVVVPLSRLDSEQIWKWADTIDPEILTLTHSCCTGLRGGCNHCSKCKLRLDMLGYKFKEE